VTAPSPPFRAEDEDLRARARAWVQRELRPHAPAWEAAGHFPDGVFTLLARDGWLGLKYEPEWGGSGGGYLADAVWTEELSRCGSGGLAAGIGAHTGIATPPIWTFGTAEQKARYLAPAIRGERIAALAITEPGAGSDVASLRTRAERVDGGWVLRGEKTYITNGCRAHVFVLAARTTPEGGHGGLSFFLVDRGPGVESRPLRKLGWHASDTATIALDDVWVADGNLLGELNRGFRLIMANFQWERLVMALGAVGGMQAAWDRAIERPLSRSRMAALATRLEAARALTYHALRMFVLGGDAVREVTQAKLLSQRTAFEFHDALLDSMGDDPDAQRAARDSRLGPIGGGTDEIMREILGRSLGL
jgi:acyl-CoA dehydrogenase